MSLKDDLKKQLLELKPIPKKVKIHEWNQDVYLRGLTANEIREIQSLPDDVAKTDIDLSMLLYCLVDDSGERLFEDVSELGGLPFPGVMECIENILKINAADERRKAIRGN